MEHANPFTPPPSSATPTFLIAAALVAVGVASVLGYRGWMQDRAEAGPVSLSASAQTPGPVAARVAAPSEALRAEALRKSRLEVQLRQAASSQAWTRCQVGEQVVYSDSGCGAGVAQRSSANSQAPITAMPSLPETRSSHILYQCKPYSGGSFWSTRHCNQQQALVDRMVNVPRNMTLNQKIALAERSVVNAQPPAQRTTAPAPISPRSAGLSNKQRECNDLDEEIRAIDARTRQPIRASEQDQLRAQRQKARDRQFEILCGRG